MVKKLLAMVLLLAAFSCGEDETEDVDGGVEAPAQVMTAAIVVDAKSLFLDCRDNKIASDEKFKGKAIEVQGDVEKVDRDIFGIPGVSLKVDEFGVVRCTFRPDQVDKLLQLCTDRHVVITGKCAGWHPFGVLVENCEILDDGSAAKKPRQYVDCESCNGIGRWRCEKCNGKGRFPCPCEGDDKKCVNRLGSGQCADCFGDGSVWCELCRGSGEIRCPDCIGTGKRFPWRKQK